MDNGEYRFRRAFVGYDRAAVDAEFDRLLSQVDDAMDKNEELRREVQDLKDERRNLETSKRALEEERSQISRERASLAESITSISGKVAELETNLTSSKAANEALQNKIDAAASEKNELQLRLDTVQERNRELTMRERQFDEIEKSVSSIMSVTKRATDRLFQKSVENQENVIRIAGDAAQEAALIRADLTAARDDMNVAFDELQDRIDKIDASLTGAVHKLVAIKHDSGLKPKNSEATIESEVERLLSLRAGEVDYSDGKGYAVPVLGPYSAKFISDAAKKVNSGEIDGNPPYENSSAVNPPHSAPEAPVSEGAKPSSVGVKKSYPGVFQSTEDSIREANKLMDAADAAAEVSRQAEPAPSAAPTPAQGAPYTNQPAPAAVPQPMPNTAPQTAYTPYQNQPYVPPMYTPPQPRTNPIGFGHRYDMNEQPEINPYAGEHFEQVDLNTLSNRAQDISMDNPNLQYMPQTYSQQSGNYDAPTMNISMSQPSVSAYGNAVSQPQFLPNAPVVSVDTASQPAQPVQSIQSDKAMHQPAEAALSAQSAQPAADEKPTARRVAVTKVKPDKTVQEKVKIVVRHSR
ncbi:MAG: hypothetical protein ACI4IJ_04990 [Acutalibacteraceae bacterium]